MKFSYSLIKKLVPGIKDKKELIRKLNLHSFETEDLGGDVFDISISPNRFSDAASHWGIAREISAIFGRNLKIPNYKIQNSKFTTSKLFQVKIQDKNICLRYCAQYFENIKIAPSPKWLQKILIDCGLRPINNVVDIMNYAMLETGQPLHAFDYDKVASPIIVKRAKKGEKITTLDDKTYNLNENILMIADKKKLLAIAGIKGGKYAEVDKSTKRIIVEAANFKGVSIYKASKILKLSTDASLRFSHNINPQLAIIGLSWVAQLLKEFIKVKPGAVIDINFTRPLKKIIKFNLERFNQFIGLNLDFITVSKYLTLLGFKIIRDPRSKITDSFLVEPPILRQDIETFEDLAEEVTRLYGYNRLKSKPPHIHLQPSGFEDQIVLKDKIKKILSGAGFDEVSNYSFIGEGDLILGKNWKDEVVELENPISDESKYLRPSLVPGLLKNIKSNFRFFDKIRIFEIGNLFYKDEKRKLNELMILSLALASKNGKEAFFELKGLVEGLFRKIGLVDYLMTEPDGKKNDWVKDFTDDYIQPGEVLKIESSGLTIGYLGKINDNLIKVDGALAEIDLKLLLKLVVEEHEYRPLSRYPSVMRDVSILVDRKNQVGGIMQSIQGSDFNYIEDVDLIDEYDDEKLGGKRSLTFRIVFQAKDRTLTDKEVNKKMEKITKFLQSRFKAKVR